MLTGKFTQEGTCRNFWQTFFLARLDPANPNKYYVRRDRNTPPAPSPPPLDPPPTPPTPRPPPPTPPRRCAWPRPGFKL